MSYFCWSRAGRPNQNSMSGFSRSDLCFTTQRREPAGSGGTEIPLIRKSRVVESSGERKGRNALRPIFLRMRTVDKAVGSAYMECGRSKVMCAVYGPRSDSRAAHFNDVGRIHCNVRFAPFSGMSTTVTEKLEVRNPLLIDESLRLRSRSSFTFRYCVISIFHTHFGL